MDITQFNSVYGSSTALSTSVKGAQDASVRFSQSASDVVKSYAAAANMVSGADMSPETLAAASDPISPMLNMKTSQLAYEASLKVFKTASDMEDSALDILA